MVAAAAVTGAALVTGLDGGDASSQRPIAEQTGQEEAEGGKTRPPGQRPRTPAGTRAIRTAGSVVVGVVVVGIVVGGVVVGGVGGVGGVAGAVVEERLDAAEARDVVDAGVGGAQALVGADPARRKRTRRPAGQTAAAFTLRADYGIVAFHPHGIASAAGWRV